jgi:hypothetical protein
VFHALKEWAFPGARRRAVSNVVVNYFIRRNCYRRRYRIREWLAKHQDAIPTSCIDLGFSPEPDSGHVGACRIVAGEAYGYFKTFKDAVTNRPGIQRDFQHTATIMDLGRFADFDRYAAAVSKASKGNINRSVKQAMRLGYQARLIDLYAHQTSIDCIRRSALFRTGGIMWNALSARRDVPDCGESPVSVPGCDKHWSMAWGVFHGPTLTAYAKLSRCGNIVRVNDLMGHRDFLKYGVVKLLMLGIVRWLYGADTSFLRGVRYLTYGALEHGKEGLAEWKLRFQFHPALVDLDTALVVKGLLPADFDNVKYLQLHPDVERACLDARTHYVFWGRTEGRAYQ